MASLKPQDNDPVARKRHGHAPHISISDEGHHVTEAIGDMYGDNESIKSEGRPLSFASSTNEDLSERRGTLVESPISAPPDQSPLARSISAERNDRDSSTGAHSKQRRREASLNSTHSSISGQTPTRSPSSDSTNTAQQRFPLNDIDYESSPAAVAQELSNLQAIRRMSLNPDTADPDLPFFSSGFSMPTVAPSNDSDENDASRLFWVPASLHPELAPKEFKTFVEDRVGLIKRRSGDEDSLSPTSVDRKGSGSSINRRKSMLSSTIEVPSDYQDGAEVLESKRSKEGRGRAVSNETTLEELELLVSNPSDMVRKMSMDSARRSMDAEGGADDDMPILPSGGQTLKRSTRTQYKKGGSIRRGERGSMSRRVPRRPSQDVDTDEEQPPTPPVHQQPLSNGLTRVATAPPGSQYPQAGQVPRRDGPLIQHATNAYSDSQGPEPQPRPSEEQEQPHQRQQPRPFQSRIARHGRTTAALPGYKPPTAVPEIVETPPPPDQYRQSMPDLPERTSSYEYSRANSLPSQSGPGRPVIRLNSMNRPKTANQTLDDMANNPSMMPGNSMSTDALSFIPTLHEEKERERKPEKKSKDRKDSSEGGSKKSGWSWMLGGGGSSSSEKDKDKKEREKEEKEASKKSKASKASKAADKGAHDNTRLDVLNTASDNPKGRESLVLDRDSIRLEEERRKESNRKSDDPSGVSGGGGGKKEKSDGLFSSFFSSSKKKDKDKSKEAERERDNASKSKHGKAHSWGRVLSPEPPRKVLHADIDYNWTRFSILEERAIYRMAHIKLANPRRALYSQVLLSNFMYSYLAKVQQMHPQIQIPAFIQQQQNKGQKQEEQPTTSDEMLQWQRYQEQQDRLSSGGGGGGGASSSGNGNANNPSSSSGSGFVEDYDPSHQQMEDRRAEDQRRQQQQYQNSYSNGDMGYDGNDVANRRISGDAGNKHPEHGRGRSRGGGGDVFMDQRGVQWQQEDPYAQQGLFDGDDSDGDDDMW